MLVSIYLTPLHSGPLTVVMKLMLSLIELKFLVMFMVLKTAKLVKQDYL